MLGCGHDHVLVHVHGLESVHCTCTYIASARTKFNQISPQYVFYPHVSMYGVATFLVPLLIIVNAVTVYV
jgi:hypothetical protein